MNLNKTSQLDLITVSSPCPASWNEMSGDDHVRFCSQCQLQVYNLSKMSREEADRFVATREGKTCVRFYRRHDGTVLTKDCPVGLAQLRHRFVRAVTALAGLLIAVISGSLFAGPLNRRMS